MPATYQPEQSVISVQGRFDANGAAEFDRVWASIPADRPHVIVDFTGVAYISSIGIRSLVIAEKDLRARQGYVILAGVTKFVKTVLETSGLLREFHLASTVAEAKDVLHAAGSEKHATTEHTVSGRRYRYHAISTEPCVLDLWGGFDLVPEDPRAAVSLRDKQSAASFSVTVAELGIAFGHGALGDSSSPEHAGPLFAGETFAAVLPANSQGQPDFSISTQPEQIEIAVYHAISFSGPPTAKIDLTLDPSAPLRTILQDIAGHISSTGVLGFLIQESATPGSMFMGISSDGHIHGTQVRFLAAPSLQPQLTDLEDVEELSADSTIHSASIQIYAPARARHGAEKLLKIEVEGNVAMREEWNQILRRLYRDCSRIVLTQLTGGYMATTFRVVSYDREGRRLLPTVAKISTNELIEREESAHKAYVQKFILNNSTTIMGSATVGEWSALRYNFLGVSGPDAALSWLQDHYHRRPVEEIQELYARLYTQILKPWYGQPRWEALKLYEDHTPLRLFPHLCEHAQRDFGFSPTAERLECEELGITFANPFRFLLTEYAARKNKTQLWYQCVTHGDLNPRNILVDELDNLYVIDFSETRLRNAVSDFARMETVLKFETPHVESADDVARLVEFEMGLAEIKSLADVPPNRYKGDDPKVEKAHRAICQLRHYADVATLFETDPTPYWLALLEWTFSVLSYDLIPLRRKYAAYSAAIICEKLTSSQHH